MHNKSADGCHNNSTIER